MMITGSVDDDPVTQRALYKWTANDCNDDDGDDDDHIRFKCSPAYVKQEIDSAN